MRFELDHRTSAGRSLGAIATLLLALAASPAPAAAPAPTAASTIRVDGAWIRWLPAGLPAGGYMELTNVRDTAATLVAVASPAFAQVSIHRSVESGGTVAMRAVARITIDAHSRVDFAASGYHFMLMQPIKPLEPGNHVPIVLRFADGSSLTVQLEVRE